MSNDNVFRILNDLRKLLDGRFRFGALGIYRYNLFEVLISLCCFGNMKKLKDKVRSGVIL